MQVGNLNQRPVCQESCTLNQPGKFIKGCVTRLWQVDAVYSPLVVFIITATVQTLACVSDFLVCEHRTEGVEGVSCWKTAPLSLAGNFVQYCYPFTKPWPAASIQLATNGVKRAQFYSFFPGERPYQQGAIGQEDLSCAENCLIRRASVSHAHRGLSLTPAQGDRVREACTNRVTQIVKKAGGCDSKPQSLTGSYDPVAALSRALVEEDGLKELIRLTVPLFQAPLRDFQVVQSGCQ